MENLVVTCFSEDGSIQEILPVKTFTCTTKVVIQLSRNDTFPRWMFPVLTTD